MSSTSDTRVNGRNQLDFDADPGADPGAKADADADVDDLRISFVDDYENHENHKMAMTQYQNLLKFEREKQDEKVGDENKRQTADGTV
jgi:hypothetical protein